MTSIIQLSEDLATASSDLCFNILHKNVEGQKNAASKIVDLKEAIKKAVGDVEKDVDRLNYLGENFYSRENVDFITGKLSPDTNMWAFFAPIGVQGDIRRVLDAAMK